MDGKSSRSKGVRPSPDKQLWVGNIHPAMTNRDLEKIFSDITPIKRAYIVTNAKTGESRGFGFVTFPLADDVELVLHALRSKPVVFRGRALAVKRPKGTPELDDGTENAPWPGKINPKTLWKTPKAVGAEADDDKGKSVKRTTPIFIVNPPPELDRAKLREFLLPVLPENIWIPTITPWRTRDKCWKNGNVVNTHSVVFVAGEERSFASTVIIKKLEAHDPPIISRVVKDPDDVENPAWTHTLILRNVPFGVTAPQLREHLLKNEDAKGLLQVRVPGANSSPATTAARNKGFAFVTFLTSETKKAFLKKEHFTLDSYDVVIDNVIVNDKRLSEEENERIRREECGDESSSEEEGPEEVGDNQTSEGKTRTELTQEQREQEKFRKVFLQHIPTSVPFSILAQIPQTELDRLIKRDHHEEAGPVSPEKMSYSTNVHSRIIRAAISCLLKQFGPIEKILLVRREELLTGSAFVVFKEKESARKAMEKSRRTGGNSRGSSFASKASEIARAKEKDGDIKTIAPAANLRYGTTTLTDIEEKQRAALRKQLLADEKCDDSTAPEVETKEETKTPDAEKEKSKKGKKQSRLQESIEKFVSSETLTIFDSRVFIVSPLNPEELDERLKERTLLRRGEKPIRDRRQGLKGSDRGLTSTFGGKKRNASGAESDASNAPPKKMRWKDRPDYAELVKKRDQKQRKTRDLHG